MAIYNVHAGHNPDGKTACGAAGILKESTEARRVKDKVIALLQAQGHTVYDCTCENGTSQNDVLKKIVAKCNAHAVSLDISIHLNAGGGTGTEVLYYSTSGAQAAQKVQNEIIAQTGYKNRGIKKRDNLYVLKNTKATAILVECCFVDSQADANMWNVDKMAAAIVSGILGVAAGGTTPSAPASGGGGKSTSDNWVANLQKECNAQGFSSQKVDGIPGKNTLAGCPTLKTGAKGNITKLLQQKLGIGTDGIFGNNTKSAVMEFQRTHGLAVDGIVGKRTWSKLLDIM